MRYHRGYFGPVATAVDELRAWFRALQVLAGSRRTCRGLSALGRRKVFGEKWALGTRVAANAARRQGARRGSQVAMATYGRAVSDHARRAPAGAPATSVDGRHPCSNHGDYLPWRSGASSSSLGSMSR